MLDVCFTGCCLGLHIKFSQSLFLRTWLRASEYTSLRNVTKTPKYGNRCLGRHIWKRYEAKGNREPLPGGTYRLTTSNRHTGYWIFWFLGTTESKFMYEDRTRGGRDLLAGVRESHGGILGKCIKELILKVVFLGSYNKCGVDIL